MKTISITSTRELKNKDIIVKGTVREGNRSFNYRAAIVIQYSTLSNIPFVFWRGTSSTKHMISEPGAIMRALSLGSIAAPTITFSSNNKEASIFFEEGELSVYLTGDRYPRNFNSLDEVAAYLAEYFIPEYKYDFDDEDEDEDDEDEDFDDFFEDEDEKEQPTEDKETYDKEYFLKTLRGIFEKSA